MVLMPKELRPGWLQRTGLVCCAIFYIGLSAIAFNQQWPNIARWLGVR
jgi:hypothetical protein